MLAYLLGVQDPIQGTNTKKTHTKKPKKHNCHPLGEAGKQRRDWYESSKFSWTSSYSLNLASEEAEEEAQCLAFQPPPLESYRQTQGGCLEVSQMRVGMGQDTAAFHLMLFPWSDL